MHYFIVTASKIKIHKSVLTGPSDPAPLLDSCVVLSRDKEFWTKVLAMYLPDFVLIKEQL